MSWFPFLVAAIVLAVTPGPGIAYVVARTLAGGRAEGLASCFGTAIGGMLHVLAAAVGRGQLAILRTICVILNTAVDVATVYAAAGLLHSTAARAARARRLTRLSGARMVALGASLALVRRHS